MFRTLRLRCPRLASQPFVKALCDLHRVEPRPYLFRQFIICFDVYLDILAVVDKRVAAALERDTPAWNITNACPACSYEVNDEPPLKFSRIISIDGNDSAKRVIRRGAPDLEGTLGNAVEWKDPRDGRAGIILRPEIVDVYAKDSVAMLGHSNTLGVEPSPCEERGGWQNMVHDEDSKSWAIFDETGIFSCLCRHGCVLVATDMIRSGEL